MSELLDSLGAYEGNHVAVAVAAEAPAEQPTQTWAERRQELREQRRQSALTFLLSLIATPRRDDVVNRSREVVDDTVLHTVFLQNEDCMLIKQQSSRQAPNPACRYQHLSITYFPGRNTKAYAAERLGLRAVDAVYIGVSQRDGVALNGTLGNMRDSRASFERLSDEECPAIRDSLLASAAELTQSECQSEPLKQFLLAVYRHGNQR